MTSKTPYSDWMDAWLRRYYARQAVVAATRLRERMHDAKKANFVHSYGWTYDTRGRRFCIRMTYKFPGTDCFYEHVWYADVPRDAQAVDRLLIELIKELYDEAQRNRPSIHARSGTYTNVCGPCGSSASSTLPPAEIPQQLVDRAVGEGTRGFLPQAPGADVDAEGRPDPAHEHRVGV